MEVRVDLRVAELLCSRLCHELVNPIGAVTNGVELISELEGRADPEALTLIGESAKVAGARLQFYRLAYGLAGATSADLTLAEAAALAESVVATGRVRLDWPKAGSDAERRPGQRAVKLFFNLLVLAAEALPRGGRVVLAFAPGSAGVEIAISAEGEQAGLSAEMLGAFTGEVAVDALSARTAHAYFTGRVSARVELPVTIAQSPGGVTFCLSLPEA